jgi:glyoxylase-like metal-dependent hydrolase (beta-lactamase superfamily II)
MIDTGPRLPDFYEYTKKQLNDFGIDFSDIERIILTHGHSDHVGLVNQIRESAGHHIDCCIHPEDAWLIAEENHRNRNWTLESDIFMKWVGMPIKEIARVKQRFSQFTEWYDPIENIRFVNKGDRISGDGYELEVIHTPGHSSGSICLYEASQKAIFSGDTVLKHITPNPFVNLKGFIPHKNDYQSLKEYIKSLGLLNKRKIRYGYPGHGGFIDNLEVVISNYLLHHRKRLNSVLKAFSQKPKTIFENLERIFPTLPESDMFLAVSEVYVHIEMLINEGKIKLIDTSPPGTYLSV